MKKEGTGIQPIQETIGRSLRCNYKPSPTGYKLIGTNTVSRVGFKREYRTWAGGYGELGLLSMWLYQ
ncbi:MAG: hypothetical protein JSW00_10165 [Thermoplasmata archaeon]|nr:MAG: hypothetical protein JSW00_10165 [Thermoplasmata archaeon]